MTLPHLSGQEIASLVSMLLVLVLWGRVLANKRAKDAELNRKLVERQNRIDAERARQTASSKKPAEPDAPKRGPWG